MSGVGRPRTPTRIKEIRGTTRKDRTNPDEPEPPKGEMVAPDFLSKAAKKNFREIVAALESLGIESPAFIRIAANAAIFMETAENCDIYLQAYFKKERCYSYTTSNSFGDKIHKPVPEVAIRDGALMKLKACLGAMGLTQSDVTKVSGKKKPAQKKNKFAEVG